MARIDTNADRDPETIGLMALGWIVGVPERLDRLLALTGLDLQVLRDRAADRDVLAAVLTFLEAHEPDLVACAASLDCPPEALVQARRQLETA